MAQNVTDKISSTVAESQYKSVSEGIGIVSVATTVFLFFLMQQCIILRLYRTTDLSFSILNAG